MKALLLAGLLLFSVSAAEKVKLSVNDLKSSSLKEAEIKSITEKLTMELFSGKVYTVLERSNMEAIMAEQMLRESELTESESSTGEEFKKPPAAEKMLSGSIEREKKSYTISLKIVDIKTGQLERVISQEFKGSFKKLLSKAIPKIVKDLTPKKPEEKP